jgi:hypothetical protein
VILKLERKYYNRELVPMNFIPTWQKVYELLNSCLISIIFIPSNK